MNLLSMTENNNLGNKYRLIRKGKNINLQVAADRITSVSHLSEWENGKASMDADMLLRLLNRINIELYDFFDQNGVAEIHFYTDDIVQLYANSDINGLKSLIDILRFNYKSYPANKTFFYKMTIAANFYMDLTGENILSDLESKKLQLKFSCIKDWYVQDVVLFSNTQLLVNPQQVYDRTQCIMDYFLMKNGSLNSMVINTTFNAIFVLLKNKKIELAVKLLQVFEHHNDSNQNTYNQIRINFMYVLINFIFTKDETSIHTFISALNTLGLNQKGEDFKFAFSQIKDIYKK